MSDKGIITQNSDILKEVNIMADILSVSTRDIEGAEKLSSLFADISEESKTMVLVYLSALRDKEIADKSRQLQEA